MQNYGYEAGRAGYLRQSESFLGCDDGISVVEPLSWLASVGSGSTGLQPDVEAAISRHGEL